MKKIDKRQVNIDLLKILACIMVITIHISAQYVLHAPLGSSLWVFNVFLDAISRAAVPLFMMITGKLLLEKKEAPLPKEILNKYVFKMLKKYVFWSLFYSMVSIGVASLSKPITLSLILGFIFPKFHLWYLASLIVVYLMLPLFYAIRDYKEGLYFKYFIYLFIIFGVFKTTILLVPNIINIESFYIVKMLNLVKYPLVELSGYFLLGYYLSQTNKKGKSSKRLFLIFLATVLIVTLGTTAVSLKQNKVYVDFFDYFVIFTFVEAICLFKIFININVSKIRGRQKLLITKISSLTFGVYLIHVFVQEQIVKKFFLINAKCLLFNFIIDFVLIFGISLLLVKFWKTLKTKVKNLKTAMF